MKDERTLTMSSAANLELQVKTGDDWLKSVLDNFDHFLVDHAANERKASSVALSLVAHYPDKAELVSQMIDLAIEELNHYKQVTRLMQQRGLVQSPDKKDSYVNQLIKEVRKGTDVYFLDRLLMAAVVEARGAERFALIARNISDLALQKFYQNLAVSEQRHHQLFVELAEKYFVAEEVSRRLQEWLTIEKNIIESLPVTGKLH